MTDARPRTGRATGESSQGDAPSGGAASGPPPPDAHASPDVTRDALDALRRIVRVLRLSDRACERQLGVSVAQLFVLQHLRDGEPRSVNDLAAATITDKSSVSGVVARLVAQGLVARATADDDARRAALTLTPAGAQLLARAPEAPQARLVAALGALPPRRRASLARSLSTVARAMGDLPAAMFFSDDDPAAGPRPRRRRPR